MRWHYNDQKGDIPMPSQPKPNLIPRMFRLTVRAGLLLIAGCSTMRTEEGYKERLNLWVDKPLDKLIDEFGYPSKKHKSPDGNIVYEYESQSTLIHGINQPSNTTSVYSTRIIVNDYVCKTWFELKEQKIIKVSYKGNDCKAEPL
tara:strand:- start:164 stop:598 length:435 start_codon:yes stop_codon:yes gene_type:complete